MRYCGFIACIAEYWDNACYAKVALVLVCFLTLNVIVNHTTKCWDGSVSFLVYDYNVFDDDCIGFALDLRAYRLGIVISLCRVCVVKHVMCTVLFCNTVIVFIRNVMVCFRGTCVYLLVLCLRVVGFAYIVGLDFYYAVFKSVSLILLTTYGCCKFTIIDVGLHGQPIWILHYYMVVNVFRLLILIIRMRSWMLGFEFSTMHVAEFVDFSVLCFTLFRCRLYKYLVAFDLRGIVLWSCLNLWGVVIICFWFMLVAYYVHCIYFRVPILFLVETMLVTCAMRGVGLLAGFMEVIVALHVGSLLLFEHLQAAFLVILWCELLPRCDALLRHGGCVSCVFIAFVCLVACVVGYASDLWVPVVWCAYAVDTSARHTPWNLAIHHEPGGRFGGGFLLSWVEGN
eukprot:gene3126-2108_t